MSSRRKSFNPFYALLVVVGVAFTVTACAYGVMTVRDLRATAPPQQDAPGEALMEQVRQHGFTALMVELAALAVATVGAIATDDYWQRRAVRERRQDERSERDVASQRQMASEQGAASERGSPPAGDSGASA